MKQISTILAILTVAFGAWFYIDETKADTIRLAMVEQRLDQKIINDAIRDNRREQRQEQDTLEIQPKNKRAERRLDELNIELNDLLEQRKYLREKK